MKATYKGREFELDDYETELAASTDEADRLALMVRLEIRAAGGDPDTVEIVDSHYGSDPNMEIKEVPFTYTRIK